MLGIAGASFAVALPLASRWYPLEHQGLALGIAGAGNSGTVIAALFAPMLGRAARLARGPRVWPPASACTLWPCFARLAKDSPHQPPPRPLADYARAARASATLGGFAASIA